MQGRMSLGLSKFGMYGEAWNSVLSDIKEKAAPIVNRLTPELNTVSFAVDVAKVVSGIPAVISGYGLLIMMTPIVNLIPGVGCALYANNSYECLSSLLSGLETTFKISGPVFVAATTARSYLDGKMKEVVNDEAEDESASDDEAASEDKISSGPKLRS